MTVTLPLSSITVKNPSGSVRVDAPEASERTRPCASTPTSGWPSTT
uniref:Uncharacterized protein n=1 Tax=Siphoviridae sp. ctu1h4 TaxID=2826499 RepID=A0A8S5MWR6_9CAUD|nr:MAG TPA: hypothetical protein [Siphoviridae sp. ctu1h4]